MDTKKDIIIKYLEKAFELSKIPGMQRISLNKLKLFLSSIGTEEKIIEDMENDIYDDYNLTDLKIKNYIGMYLEIFLINHNWLKKLSNITKVPFEDLEKSLTVIYQNHFYGDVENSQIQQGNNKSNQSK